MSDSNRHNAPLRLSRSVVGREEAEAVTRIIMEEGYLGMGAEVQRLEAEIAAYLGVAAANVSCVNTGTAALHLAVQAAVPQGGEVLVQSVTYVASFQAIRAAGAVPVACEALPASVTIDLDDAARRLTPRTRAIMPVHYAGYAGDLDAVYAFADRHGLRVIEDAAHAFGSSHRGRLIGSFGDIVCFSFDGIKNITCGEGGAIVSADPAVNAAVKDARLLGVERDTEKRFAGQRSWNFDVTAQGWRYHMSNIMAAIGRVQLRRLPQEFAPARRRLSALYRELLQDTPGVALLETDAEGTVPHIMAVRITDGRRDTLRGLLDGEGLTTGLHYRPNHLHTLFGGASRSLPVSERLEKELLTLPLHPALSEDDVRAVCTRLRTFMQENR
ncbi:DegT/DnrJ/EryC1/StrS aminotransferase [Oleidesulfovibrio alaskensis G20]|jgi:dTDP-4-amino-4,6-dideoxygalactose transaminase|uniref:DegT/DnrJ/EryC1/StrS aminotransferase n=1 Tax=Oleidesulfovibrio alaskensis (strain ATCC BAA-1058 / DSM 17464 / G20) TaxID=207559 RepID=Q30V06_OLEA2|nr:DegT/DnrJ/EryC1/StrS family aminotransferase [Oleidesulfovibrio alaskensis]ABB40490.1 DegT/DnrJ/EryC1/StrS aminotransferase [Oleidesulfovibrio alaskensis G20]MBG0772743.1 DegT/DnrJ/EryC1/StrS family aminotransferase [Oleidesulfovibrio alaskensis]